MGDRNKIDLHLLHKEESLQVVKQAMTEAKNGWLLFCPSYFKAPLRVYVKLPRLVAILNDLTRSMNIPGTSSGLPAKLKGVAFLLLNVKNKKTTSSNTARNPCRLKTCIV